VVKQKREAEGKWWWGVTETASNRKLVTEKEKIWIGKFTSGKGKLINQGMVIQSDGLRVGINKCPESIIRLQYYQGQKLEVKGWKKSKRSFKQREETTRYGRRDRI